VYKDVKQDALAFLLKVWDDVYTKPYCRAAPWIIGIFLGIIMFKYRKVTIHWVLVNFLSSRNSHACLRKSK
jgi:hypothetical protein